MESLPKRKPNRWMLADYDASGVYFLTICVKNRRNLLSRISVGDGAPTSRNEGSPILELTEMGKIVEKYILSSSKMDRVVVDKYVIMPNHIHVIVYVKERRDVEAPSPTNRCGGYRDVEAPSPTDKIIPRLVSAFKRLCNREIGENVFQRSYYDHIIRDQQDYEKHAAYIFENPSRWYYDELYNE